MDTNMFTKSQILIEYKKEKMLENSSEHPGAAVVGLPHLRLISGQKPAQLQAAATTSQRDQLAGTSLPKISSPCQQGSFVC